MRYPVALLVFSILCAPTHADVVTWEEFDVSYGNAFTQINAVDGVDATVSLHNASGEAYVVAGASAGSRRLVATWEHPVAIDRTVDHGFDVSLSRATDVSIGFQNYYSPHDRTFVEIHDGSFEYVPSTWTQDGNTVFTTGAVVFVEGGGFNPRLSDVTSFTIGMVDTSLHYGGGPKTKQWSLDITPVPEPSTWLLAVVGLLCLFVLRRTVAARAR